MADLIDIAYEREQDNLNHAMRTHKERYGEAHNPTNECVDCGEIIPVERRAAKVGCLRCVHCQERVEIRAGGNHRKRVAI